MQADADCWVRSYAYAKQVFRGEHRGERKISTGFKADWKLVPRHEEAKFTSSQCKRKPNTFPTSVPFPPLFAHLVKTEKQRTGQVLEGTPMLPLVFNKGTNVTNEKPVAEQRPQES